LITLEFDLRHFKTETIKAYGEIAIEMTMVKGLTEDSIKRLASLKEQIDQRFGHVDIRLSAMDAHLEGMDARLKTTDTHLEGMDARLKTTDTHLEGMDARLGRVENMLAQILARLPQQPE